jgi:hypothetical protein
LQIGLYLLILAVCIATSSLVYGAGSTGGGLGGGHVERGGGHGGLREVYGGLRGQRDLMEDMVDGVEAKRWN